MNTYNTTEPTIKCYHKYKHCGITDEEIKSKYTMTDAELDRLMFINYTRYALIMEQCNSKK